MRVVLIFIISLGLSFSLVGQSRHKECHCPKNPYADTIPEVFFKLRNGTTIALSGSSLTMDDENVYSNFVLCVCGQNKIIDFWDTYAYYKFRTNKDTLVIEELRQLPTGDNLSFKPTIWTYERLYLRNGQVERKRSLNNNIRPYNRQETDRVLKEYKQTWKDLSDEFMDLAYKLFLATISGDKTARQYFEEFKTKFGPLDGATAEDYNELTAMLRFWDSVHAQIQ